MLFKKKKKDLNEKAERMKLISASVGTPGCSCTLVCVPLPFSRATSCVVGLREGQGKGLTTALREMLCVDSAVSETVREPFGSLWLGLEIFCCCLEEGHCTI